MVKSGRGGNVLLRRVLMISVFLSYKLLVNETMAFSEITKKWCNQLMSLAHPDLMYVDDSGNRTL